MCKVLEYQLQSMRCSFSLIFFVCHGKSFNLEILFHAFKGKNTRSVFKIYKLYYV